MCTLPADTMTASGSVTFRSAIHERRMEVPVKGTFIHFDIPQMLPAPLQRSSTCPSLLHLDFCTETAASHLCHAMMPQSEYFSSGSAVASCSDKAAVSATASSVGADSGSLKSRVHPDAEGRESSPDGISDASTKESSGVPGSPNNKEAEALQSWTCIPSRNKKPVNAVAPRTEPRNQVPAEVSDSQVAGSASSVVVQPPPQVLQRNSKGASKGGKSDLVASSEAFAQKPRGKGKGLSHFERIEVGIEDDDNFHIVQRLIGPRGKHMQDITNQCQGAKVWIIGRGSRSWEDSVGPLMICVGASLKPTFDAAVSLIRELLERVRADYKAFLGQ